MVAYTSPGDHTLNRSANIRQMKRFSIRIIFPTIIAMLLFIVSIFLVVIPRYKENIMDGKREMIQELTNSAWSILSEFEHEERAGLLTREEAQAAAASRIKYLRYGEENKDYFWITDTMPTMVMHPFRHELNGQSLTDFRDPHGKRMFVAFVETVKKSESGYVDYMWQWKDDSLHIVPKLSFVKIFKPWNWVIGTGIYIEDAKKEIATLTRNLIWLTAGIAALMAFLLFYILQQSYRIERKRREAEVDLHISKERYRALVEAAREGLLMVVNGTITYSNAVISKMTGYSNAELNNMPFQNIVRGEKNHNLTRAIANQHIHEGDYEVTLLKNDGSTLETLITASLSEFSGKTVNILIVKEVSGQDDHRFSNTEYQRVINTLNLGFFKARLDYKGKFLYANPTALRILGFGSFQELSLTPVLKLLADSDDRKSLRRNLVKSGYLKNKAVRISRKDGGYSTVSVTLVMARDEEGSEPICDGIIEDITLQQTEKTQQEQLVAGLWLSDNIMDHAVGEYAGQLVTIDADAHLSKVVDLMQKRDTDALVVTKGASDCIGVITNTDVQRRIVALGLRLDNPAYLIMSAPIVSVHAHETVFTALERCEKRSVSHLLVKNGAGHYSGMVSLTSLSQEMYRAQAYLYRKVKTAQSVKELSDIYPVVHKLLKALSKRDVAIHVITTMAGTFSDAITSRIIELTIGETTAPPASFAFVCLGSEGRKEETLFTDQDNAIVFDNVPKEALADVQQYFLKLGTAVCKALHTVGYSYCKGNVMAQNPQWNQPLSQWEQYFNQWIKAPEPQNLLDAMIFFDLRCVYGDSSLTDRLGDFIAETASDKTVFFYHLALNTCQMKPAQIQPIAHSGEKGNEGIDLKNALLPLTMFARTYAIRHNIRLTGTLERLEALRATNTIDYNMINEISYAFGFLMKLRFRAQAVLSDENLPLSNSLVTHELVAQELYLLKKVLSSIGEYQEKIRIDFKV